jgi:hypothetical protein
MAMLSEQDHGRSQEVGSTHEMQVFDPYWLEWIGYKVAKNFNLRLGEETKGLQVKYHRMGRVRAYKKIFGAPQW